MFVHEKMISKIFILHFKSRKNEENKWTIISSATGIERYDNDDFKTLKFVNSIHKQNINY